MEVWRVTVFGFRVITSRADSGSRCQKRRPWPRSRSRDVSLQSPTRSSSRPYPKLAPEPAYDADIPAAPLWVLRAPQRFWSSRPSPPSNPRSVPIWQCESRGARRPHPGSGPAPADPASAGPDSRKPTVPDRMRSRRIPVRTPRPARTCPIAPAEARLAVGPPRRPLLAALESLVAPCRVARGTPAVALAPVVARAAEVAPLALAAVPDPTARTATRRGPPGTARRSGGAIPRRRGPRCGPSPCGRSAQSSRPRSRRVEARRRGSRPSARRWWGCSPAARSPRSASCTGDSGCLR